MALIQTFRTHSFDQWRINTNAISANVGDIANISATITNRTDVVAALNDLISYIGSASLTTSSQNLRGAVNELKDSALTFAGAKTFSGAVQINNTLGVTGALTAAAISGSDISASGTLSSTGNFAVNTNRFNVAAASGNTTIAGTLGVTGASSFATLGSSGLATLNSVTVTNAATLNSTLSVSGISTLATVNATVGSFSSTLSSTGNFAVNTNRFNVTAASGNTTIAGTLGVTGASSFSSGSFSSTLGVTGDFAVNTNRFNVAAASGNTTIAGTLGVTGASSLAGLTATTGSFSSTLGVSGTATLSGLTVLSSALNDGSTVLRFTNSNGAFVSSPNRFTVDTAGNVVIQGNLTVAGSTSIAGSATISVDWSSITSKPSPVVQVTLTGPVTGSGSATLSSLAAGTYTASFATSITAGSVTLGTHTTGNYVATAAAGSGISLAGTGSGPYTGNVTITNSDRGSSQNIFKAVAVSGQTTINTTTNNDTLTFVAGANVTLTTNSAGKSVTISAASASPNDTAITFAAGTGMSGGGGITLNQVAPATITFTNSDRGSSQNIFKTVASAGSTSLVAGSNTDTLSLVAGQVSGTPGIAISLNTTGGQNVVVSHFDTSSVSNTSNASGVVLQNLTFDTYGHVLSASGVNLDSRYLQSYTETSTLDAVTGRGATTSNSITVGGLTATGNGNIGGNLTVTGDLTVNGTTTTVNATTIAVSDPVITLGGATPPISNDGKDRGVEYRYFSGSAKIGWFGRRSSNNRLTFYSDATNTSEVFSGTLGDIEASTFYGALSGNATTASTLQTPRTINGVSFNGSANITVTANTTNALTIGTGLSGGSFNGSGAVTITLAASGVGTGSTVGSASAIPVLTYDTYGRITAVSTAPLNNGGLTLSVSGVGLSGSGSFTANQSGSSSFTVTSNATSSNTASTLVSRDASGNFSAGTITATLVGNATNISAYSINQNLATSSNPTFAGVNSSAQSIFQGSQTASIATATGNLGGALVQGSGSNAAFIAFNRPSLYGSYFGIDTDNKWKVGGWSAGAQAYEILHAGNYNSFAPTLTGTGASGSWGINVTGSAGSVLWTNVTSRPTAVSSFSNDAGYLANASSPNFTALSLTANSSINITEGWGMRFGSPGGNHPHQFSNSSLLVGGTASGSNYGTGNIYATGDVVASYSDERLKKVVGPISGALQKVRELNGFYYYGNEVAAEMGYDTNRRQVGVSAQAVERVLPEIVTKMTKSLEDGSDYKTLDYAKLVPLLIEAIKELANKLESK